LPIKENMTGYAKREKPPFGTKDKQQHKDRLVGVSIRPALLLIDDESNIIRSLARVFSEEPYEIYTTSSGVDAVCILERERIDLIISDYKMPGMTGVDLLREANKRWPDTIRIMLTGHADIQAVQKAVNDGAIYKFITKPWSDEDLRLTVSRALQHKALREEKLSIEAESERYRSHLEAIFHSVEEGIITVDNDMHVIEANEAAGKICGISPKSREWEKGETDCSRKCMKVLEEAVIKRRPVHEYLIECEHLQRPRQTIILNSSPLRDKGKNPLGAVIVIRDISRLTHLERELQERHKFHSLIGKSIRMQDIYNLIERLKDTDTTVLITGKSGTGKEVVANAIHYSGSRAHEPFIVVNCSALSENLLESELFGHVKGAFTGAIRDKKGRFQLAEHGTIFLDEIGDISSKIQLKLLRVLENKTIERVGDETSIKLDVQVISATNTDLREKVKSGEFREDLFYRLKVMEIRLPLLMERRDDIPLLVKHYLDVFREKFRKEIISISPNVERLFMDYSWPGNVRELVHTIEHAFVICQNRTIEVEDLPPEIREHIRPEEIMTMGNHHECSERDTLLDALRKTGWNKAKAAKILGISRPTIYKKMIEFAILSTDELM
jgi:two-component system, NtrC family, response regulator HydG